MLILVCVWIGFGLMLNTEASVKATSMMSFLSYVLIVGALSAVQTGNGNGP